MKQLRYNMYNRKGCVGHPQQVMKDLGFKVIHALPQSICDQWWFTVEDYDIKLPEFLTEMTYDLKEWGYCDDLKEERHDTNYMEIPEGWKQITYHDKTTGCAMNEFKLYDNDVIKQFIVFIKKNDAIKGFDKLTGKILEIK